MSVQTILVVDDNLASRELLRAILKGPSRRILEASDGKEAVGIIENQQPDLVLLDIEMPVLDGYGVLRSLRAQPGLASLPILAVSANAMDGARDRALAAGFDDYVTKPIDCAALRRHIAALLGAGQEEK